MSELPGDLQDRTFARATAATAGSYPAQRRLSAAQLASYLDRRAFAVVASTRTDGRPHAAMSVYIRRGTTFWLPTMAGSVRERNLRAEPWLTLTVSEGARDGEHTVVLIEGPATVVPLAEVPADVLARAPRYGVWVRLLPERLLSYADDSRR
jgi:nitroimidazol reductase NimA-like FMN-containing flavoprotein (pyridoxamine 5'-phosphate oxidase superfamily)